MLENARFIVVEGPIGAGKTTLARRLSSRLEAQLILESPEKNPFLSRFYQNLERWALPTQLAFLHQRIDALATVPEKLASGQRVVSDFLLEKDPLFAGLNLPADELALYQRIYAQMPPSGAPAPDLVIYLQARPDTLVERIRRRGMDAERRITETYVERVIERYARFFYDFDAAPLFVVDAEVLNPVDHEDDFELLIERLLAMRGYREFFGYA